MRRRWLLALALAAGCGSGASGRDAAVPDAGDGGPKDVVAPPETRADTGSANDVGNDILAEVAAESGPEVVDASDAPESGADAPLDAPNEAIQTLCPAQIPAVTIASGRVNGVLQGASSNPAVSCHGGVPTGGPEAFFTLTITQDVTIDLTVASPIDTLIAIRPGACSDAISELVCGEDPPKIDADAGAPPPPPTDDAGTPLRLTGLRAPLAPGTYTIVVDSYTLGSLPSAGFTLTINHLAPRANASCGSPTLLAAGTTTTGEPLDLAGTPRSVCGGGIQSSLYYTVGVPSGQRLTARATPRGSNPMWMPRLEAFASCSANTCLAQGHLVAGLTQQLDWINNGPTWQLVYLAVGADAPVAGATFDLAVNILDLFATCLRPMTVKDGTMLPAQDLSIAAPATGATCSGVVDHAFYYSATLLPQQSITVQAQPSVGSPNFIVPNVSIRQSCDTLSCLSNGSGSAFVNQSTSDMTVLVEVSSQRPGFVGPFDLFVSMPPPPPNIIVTPPSGLVTTESGGTATFTVVLGSPPTADVTIGLASDTPTEGTASPATLRFTSANWRTAQTVTVTGVDDQVGDGAHVYSIVTSAATSTDDGYNGLDPEDVEVTNLDNDPGVSVVDASDVVTSESGMKSTFTVSLNAAPTANVTMALSSNDVGEGTVSPATLTFTTTNWNMQQTVTVTGVDDVTLDGTQAYTIVTGALASTDARYGGQDPPDISAHNLDDDQTSVGLKVVSTDHTCGNQSAMVSLAVDRANQIYLVMPCDNGLWLTTSTDAGATFTDPTLIPGTEVFGSQAHLVGGAAGFAYMLFDGNDGNIYFMRTADGGVTWSTRVTMSDRQDFMHLGAAGKTVLVMTPGPGPIQSTLSRSIDGGRSFLAKSIVDGTNDDIVVEPDGRTAWMVESDSNGVIELRNSVDGGAKFTKTGVINQDLTTFHLVGNNDLFTMSGPLQIIDLGDPTMVSTSIGFINAPPFAMAVDDVDGLAILDSDNNGHLRATHVIMGATPPTDGRSLGPSPSAAGIAALSRKAAAVAIMNGNLVLYTTVVW